MAPLLNIINEFGSFSGYKINWGKSELMPLSHSVDKIFPKTTPHEKCISLGIIVTRKLGQLMELNWDMKTKQLMKNIEIWNTISKVGHINVVKMVASPRCFSLFQCTSLSLISRSLSLRSHPLYGRATYPESL